MYVGTITYLNFQIVWICVYVSEKLVIWQKNRIQSGTFGTLKSISAAEIMAQNLILIF